MSIFDAADYARTLTFRDDAPDSSAWPCHIVGRKRLGMWNVELDGKPIAGVLDADIAFGTREATVVTLYVLPEYAAIPFWDSEGELAPGAIDGVPVVSPHPGDEDTTWTYTVLGDSETEIVREVVACDLHVHRIAFE